MSGAMQARGLCLALTVVCGLAFVWGCGSSAPPVPPPTRPDSPDNALQPDPTPVHTDTLRLMYYESPTILNPYLSSGSKDFEASRIVYEPLASVDSAGNLVPILAAAIPTRENGDISADYTSVTWRLRPGLRWSDGAAMTAQDVQFTFSYITNEAVPASFASLYEMVERVEVVDDVTLTVHFRGPNPAWDVPFVGYGGCILPKHIFEPYNNQTAPEAPANNQPVGTGPYMVTSVQPDKILFLDGQQVETKRITYLPNPYYREREGLAFDKIELYGGGSPEQATKELFEEGKYDYVYNLQVSGDELQALLKQPGYGQVVFNFDSGIVLLTINHTDPREGSQLAHPHPILADTQVRQALAHAIDRQRIAAEVFGQAARPTWNMLVAPPQYQMNTRHHPYNLEQARALLAAAGWHDLDGDGVREKDGRELRLECLTYVSPRMQALLHIMARDFEQVGIALETSLADPGTLFSSDISKDMIVEKFPSDMMVFEMTMDSRDPGDYVGWWRCSQIPQRENDWAAGLNVGRWCRPAYDALYEQSLHTFDTEERRQLLGRMNDMLMEEVVFIPIVHVAELSGIHRSLWGVALTPWDTATWNIAAWYRERQASE
jgi:peptide/nickel transport system substrate-binding protein